MAYIAGCPASTWTGRATSQSVIPLPARPSTLRFVMPVVWPVIRQITWREVKQRSSRLADIRPALWATGETIARCSSILLTVVPSGILTNIIPRQVAQVGPPALGHSSSPHVALRRSQHRRRYPVLHLQPPPRQHRHLQPL